MIYFIRHAEKLENSVHAELSDKGLNDAFLYGKYLNSNNIKIDRIVTSPINRCVQTAKKITEGYGTLLTIEESTLLGNPGTYINDGDDAMKIFNEHSLVDIINMQLSKQELDGFNKIDEATQNLLSFMKNKGDNVLYISHDAIITPFIHYIENINSIEEKDIIDFLCGYSNEHKYLTSFWKRTSKN